MYGADFTVVKNRASGLEGEGVEQDVGETCGTCMDDNPDKREIKNERSTAESRTSFEAPDRKLSAASILQS